MRTHTPVHRPLGQEAELVWQPLWVFAQRPSRAAWKNNPQNIVIIHLCSLIFATSFLASTSLCSKRSHLAFTAGQDLATCVHILEGFFLGSTMQPAQGKALREVWWGWLWPHRYWDLKGIQRRHYKQKSRRIKCAAWPSCLFTHAKSIGGILLPTLPIYYTSHNLCWCSQASAAKEPDFTGDTQLPLQRCSSRTWLLCPCVHGRVGEGSETQFRWCIPEV